MAFEAGGSGALGIGQGGPAFPQEDSPVASAASAGVDPQMAQQQAQRLIQALIQSRMGGGSPITFGPQPPAGPRLPSKPMGAGFGPGIPQGSFATSGERKRAQKQALFGTVSDIINKAESKHYEDKVNKIKGDFETLTNAIQGYQEAQASGNQQAMEHNAKIINGIVMDPKKSKEMAKAFDVNLNPMADKKKEKPNPAHDALKAAFAKDTQDYTNKQTPLTPQAQAFMRQMPQRQGMDPRLAIIEQLTKAGVLPKASEEMTFTKDLMEIQQRIQNNKFTNETKMQLGKMLGEAMMDRTKMQSRTQIERTMMTIKGANDRMDVLMEGWRYRADKKLEETKARVAELQQRFSSKAATTASDKKFSEYLKSLDERSNALEKQLTAATKNHNTDEIKRINGQIDQLSMAQSLASAEAAKRVGLDPNDVNPNLPMLNDDEMNQFRELYKGIEDDASSADQ